MDKSMNGPSANGFSSPDGIVMPKYTWKKKAASEIQKRCLCTKDGLKALLCSFFPFLAWTREYAWRRDFISDLVAGVTVGIMSIPQGMSYSGVAGVPAAYGLYSNIFPTIMYFFVGTSRMAAIGPPAVVSIMMGNVRHKFIPDMASDYSVDCYLVPDNGTKNYKADHVQLDATLRNNPACFTSWELLISLTMLTGIILVIMGILRFGYFSKYLSESLVGGFTSGAAVHAMTSQLGYVFGLYLPWYTGVGKIIRTYIDLFKMMHEAVLATVIISAVCMTTLLIVKLVLNTRFQRAFGAPLPGELLAVLIGTAVSYFGRLEEKYHVATVRNITAGFPQPLVPRFDLMQILAVDALCLAAVLYSLSISLAKLYAKRNDYKIDANQEFFAFGSINIVGSFFQCIAAGQIVSRSAVYESAGAKSQFAGAFGSVFVIATILYVAPLLASLPKCILGSIIWVACMQMLKQLKQLKVLWSTSKFDFVIYFFTFISVVLLDVKEGLLASVIFAGLISLIRTLWLKRRKDKQHAGDDPYQKLEVRPKDRIFQFDEPLYFANVDRFKRQLYEVCGLTAEDVRQDAAENELAYYRLTEPISTISTSAEDQAQRRRPNEGASEYVIIDCSAFHYIDSMGVRALRQADQDLARRGITIYYVKCTGDNLKKLMTAQFLDDTRKMRFFPNADIAIAAAQFRNRSTQYGTNETIAEGAVAQSDVDRQSDK